MIKILYLLFFCSLSVHATQTRDAIALLSKDSAQFAIEHLPKTLQTVSDITATLCSSTSPVIVFSNTDALNLSQHCSPPPPIIGLFLSHTDVLQTVSARQKIYSAAGLYEQLVVTQRMIEGNMTVIYSEEIERQAIQAFQKKYPRRSLLAIKVEDPNEAVKVLGRFVLKSSAVILGENENVFNDAFWRTARKISLKFLTPLIGGYSEEGLKKGLAFGVYIPEEEALRTLEVWQTGGQWVQPKSRLLINRKMMTYFGIAIENE